jgi:hypothetical protein
MAKTTVRTIWKKNTLPAMLKRLELEKSNANVTIGVHGQEGSAEKKSRDEGPAKLLLVDVATFMEFGTVNVPQRSFIRANDALNYRKYRKVIEEIKDKILFDNMKMSTGLGLLGELILRDIRTRIRSGIKPDLQPETIKAKGSSLPLVDTGQLINGLTYYVRGVKKNE